MTYTVRPDYNRTGALQDRLPKYYIGIIRKMNDLMYVYLV